MTHLRFDNNAAELGSVFFLKLPRIRMTRLHNGLLLGKVQWRRDMCSINSFDFFIVHDLLRQMSGGQ